MNNQMIVISDGDMIANDTLKGSIAPLGYDRFTRNTFGNKSFIQNCIDYLCDDSNLMQVRNKVSDRGRHHRAAAHDDAHCQGQSGLLHGHPNNVVTQRV